MGSDSYEYERLNGLQWTECDEPDAINRMWSNVFNCI